MIGSMETRELAEIGILGALNERGELTQEEIKEFLQETFSEYWGYGSGVISPATQRLVDNDRIRRSVGNGGSKYEYEITEDGRKRLMDFLRDSIDVELIDLSTRHHLVIKLGFLHHLPEREQQSFFTSIDEKLRNELEKWEAVQERFDSGEDATGYRRDFVQLKIEILEVHLEWVDQLEFKSIDNAR